MAEARKRLDVNVYENLAIEKEAYEAARRNALAQGATATETLREGDPRALAAGVGRVQLAQQMGQEKISLAQQQEQSQLDKLVAAEEGRLKDIDTSMDLMEVQGAQLAARDAEEAEAHAIEQGIAGIGDMAGEFASMAKLYDDSDLTPAQLKEKYAERDAKQGARIMRRDKRREARKPGSSGRGKWSDGVDLSFNRGDYDDFYDDRFTPFDPFDIRQGPYYGSTTPGTYTV